MVNLSVFTGPAVGDEPRILPFQELAPKIRRRRRIDTPHAPIAVVRRAWVELHNRVCPSCRRVTVEPVELQDCSFDRKGARIPGTATIVGFSCTACGHQWSSP